MKKQTQIVFIERDEISLFLAESILSAFEKENKVDFFKETEDALAFIKSLPQSEEQGISIFINAADLIGEVEILKQIRETLLPYPSRFCLLTSVPGADKREKEFLKELGVSCFIEKPLTEEKLKEAFQRPFLSAQLK